MDREHGGCAVVWGKAEAHRSWFGSRSAPALGDIRILAAMIAGKPHLIGMKPISNQPKRPQDYFTPAGGTKHFDFVGDIPDADVHLTLDPDGKGCTALFAVPLSLLEFPVGTGSSLKGDAEVLLSGQGSRGFQTITRNPLFAAGHEQTTMVDDTPTESWLYPQFWGDIAVK